MQDTKASDWARAIATRIADEWAGQQDAPEDAVLLEEVLRITLTTCPEQCLRLVGTGVIEEDYFEELR